LLFAGKDIADREEKKVAALDDILTRALVQRWCPICLILEQKTRDLLCRLQYDAVHDNEVKEFVITSGGYCHFHFWYLDKLTSPTTNAQLLEKLLEKIRTNFPDYQNTAQRDPGRLVPDVHCPVCSSCRTWEEEFLALFVAKIAQTDFQALYYDSRGLCLPHLVQVLRLISDAKLITSLMAAAARQLELLIQELRLQVTKWRNKDRSPGEEQDSTYRAIEKLVGGSRYRTG